MTDSIFIEHLVAATRYSLRETLEVRWSTAGVVGLAWIYYLLANVHSYVEIRMHALTSMFCKLYHVFVLPVLNSIHGHHGMYQMLVTHSENFKRLSIGTPRLRT